MQPAIDDCHNHQELDTRYALSLRFIPAPLFVKTNRSDSSHGLKLLLVTQNPVLAFSISFVDLLYLQTLGQGAETVIEDSFSSRKLNR